MVNFQGRIRPEFWHLYEDLQPDVWYDIEPLWTGSTTRRLDMADKRVARLKTPWGHTSLRAEYLDIRKRPRGRAEMESSAEQIT